MYPVLFLFLHVCLSFCTCIYLSAASQDKVKHVKFCFLFLCLSACPVLVSIYLYLHRTKCSLSCLFFLLSFCLCVTQHPGPQLCHRSTTAPPLSAACASYMLGNNIIWKKFNLSVWSYRLILWCTEEVIPFQFSNICLRGWLEYIFYYIIVVSNLSLSLILIF